MDIWQTTYQQLVELTKTADTLFFRGHCDATWPLLPALARMKARYSNAEKNLYFEFITRAGELLREGISPWTVAFLMQHHGLPTRLLDWSETFGVALYFALLSGNGDAAVWILDPYELNRRTINRASTINPTDLRGTYDDYFVNKTMVLEGNTVAISPLRHNPRVFHQRSAFTLHDDLNVPLEELHPEVVKKLTIPAAARSGALHFLRLAGLSEFSLFPDLDGLSRELRAEYFYPAPVVAK